MALTPDTPNESFMREVDENLRRDRLEGFAKTYGVWIAVAVVLFLAAVGGWLYWQSVQQEEAAQRSEELMSIYDDIGAGNLDRAQQRLQPLEESGNEMVRALALLTDAAIALQENDRQSALANYRTIAADEDMPDPYRNLALVRSTAIEFDSLKPEEVISRLQPLAEAGNPWFASAGELTAMAYLKQGQKERAGRVFAAIAKDETVPVTMRSRAVQIAGSLGVDANVDLPQQAQPGNAE